MPRSPTTVAQIFAVLAVLLLAPVAWADSGPSRTDRLAEAKSWGFQLQDLDVARLRTAPHDVLVIDYSKDGSDEAAFTAAEIGQLKRKPDGTPRLVLAYLSIGEAEDYRYYWQWTWGGSLLGRVMSYFKAPDWLGPTNTEWAGNYAVRYWMDGWQRIILGDGGYLDRIVKAGFDGVYLDKIDSSLEPIAAGRDTAKAEMRTFVARIAERGRRQSPGFLIVPQNGEELLDDAAYLDIVDGMGKEDLLFGEIKDKQPNPADIFVRRVAMMKPLRATGKPVLAVEYIDDPALIPSTRATLEKLGYVPLFADRELGALRQGDLPDGQKTVSVRRKRAKAWIF